jgi:hypothetical protein
MEPVRRIELRLPPYRSGVLPLSLNRHELGTLGSNQRFEGQGLAACQLAESPSGAPARCYPGLAVLTRNARTLVPGAACPRRDSNAHYRSPRDRDSCRLVYEDVEPSSGADPDHTPYGGAVTAVCDGLAAHRGFEPRLPNPESGVLPVERMGIGAEDASRTRKPRGLSSRGLPVAVTPAKVRHLGLEPRTSGLRVRHSAIELAAHGASPGN